MFGPFKLRSTLGRSYNADLDDTKRTKQALKRIGYFEEPDYGLTEFPDEPLFKGIETFQRDQGLRRDGIMKPEGETAAALGKTLAELEDHEDTSTFKTERIKENENLASAAPKPATPLSILKRLRQAFSTLSGSAAGSKPENEIAFAPAIPFAVWLMPILGAATAAAAMAIYKTLSKSRRDKLRRRYQKETDSGEDPCYRRYLREFDKCSFLPTKWQSDCRQRATIRWDMCNRNGGEPDPKEPPEWSNADMEIRPPR